MGGRGGRPGFPHGVWDPPPRTFENVFKRTLLAIQGGWEEQLLSQEPVKRQRVADVTSDAKEYVVQKEKVQAVKAHFVWILGRTSNVEISKSYIKNMIAGFDVGGDDWEVMKGLIGALGLMKEGPRADSQKFTLLKPKETDDVTHVTEQLAAWLQMTEPQKKVFTDKLSDKAEVNEKWSKSTFDYVLKSVRAGGSEALPSISLVG